MKTYWQVAWAKHPSFNDTEITILGSLVVEWEGDGVPEWEELRRAVFPVSHDTVVELLNPQFRLKGLSDSLRSQKPRLAANTYKVWVIGGDHDPEAAVSENKHEA